MSDEEKLAIEGGEPAIKEPLPPWPWFTEEIIQAAMEPLRTGKVNYWTGKLGMEFERKFAEWNGAKYCITTTSGTSALHTAVASLGIGPGDEVIVPSYSFIATAFCVLQAGAIPVFADVRREDHCIDPEDVKRKITKRTRAIIPVHLYGNVCEMDEIMEIAEKYDLFVIEDCAEAHGALYKGKKVGTIGHAGCFSFCQNKTFTTGGEGGAVITNDEDLAWMCRSFRDHGYDVATRLSLLEAEGKRLLYTSDYNAVRTRLLNEADQDYGDLDVVIIESTYADENHTERGILEKRFVEEVTEVVESGGTVLVPAFSVGRAQEIACILSAYHFEYSVYLDGMAREASTILMNHVTFIRDPRLFLDAMHRIDWIEGWRDRRTASKKPGVIIAPAGMLKGGPAAFYIQTVGKKSRNAVFLVGYQIPGTPGRELIERGVCVIDGKVRKVKAKVEFFDFSSHSGAKELKETVKNLKGSPKVYVVHGAEGNCPLFARWIKEEVGLEAKAPKIGETFKI